MMHGFGWAKHPMVHRVHQLRADVPITIMYGSRSWIDHSASQIVQQKRTDSYVNVQVSRFLDSFVLLSRRGTPQVVSGAGHHVYADKPAIFNQFVNDACNLTDSNELSVVKYSLSAVEQERQTNSGNSPETSEDDGDNKPLPITD